MPAEYEAGAGDPLWRWQPLTREACFYTMGRRLCLQASSDSLLAWAETSFGAYRAHASEQPDIHVELVGPPTPPGPPGDDKATRSERSEPESATAAIAARADAADATFASTAPVSEAWVGIAAIGSRVDPGRPREPLHREREGLYAASLGGSLTIADLAARRIVIFVDPESAPEASVREVVLESPVWRTLAHEGLVALHGAGLVLGGRGWLLRGASGAGKSCLALAAAMEGVPVLSDETCWLDPLVQPAQLRGAPWSMRFESGARSDLPELRAALALGRARPDGKLELALVDLAPGACRESAAQGGLIFLDRGPTAQPARLLGIDADEAMHRFVATSHVGETSQDPRALAAARDRLIEGGAYRLLYGAPASALACLRGALGARLDESLPGGDHGVSTSGPEPGR